MANWHDFEKDAAVYFERLHQVSAKFTDSGKAERVVKRDSHKVQPALIKLDNENIGGLRKSYARSVCDS